jgi:two-component system sensor histidine kinase PrrB
MTSLRTHVAIAAMAAVAVTLAAVLFVVVSSFSSGERRDLDQHLLERAHAIQQAAGGPPRAQPPPPGGAPPPRGQAPLGASLSRRVEQAVAQGGETARLLHGSNVVDVFGAPAPKAGFPAPRATGTVETVTVGGVGFRAIALDVNTRTDAGEEVLDRLEVASPTADVEGRIADLRRRVLLIGLVGLLLSAGVALLAGRLTLRSLERLRARVAVVRDPNEQAARIPRGGPREVDDLAGTVNAMLDRIASTGAARDAALEASRRFAADVGHELRTPLAAIAANVATLGAHPDLDPAERGAIVAALAEDEERLAALLAALQALARADAAEAVPRERVDVAELADAAVHAARRRRPDTAIALSAPAGDAATVDGWPDGLRLAIDNLIENAALHGAGAIAVTVGLDPVTVTVDDAGLGIPAAERGAVSGRFVRGSGARGAGSGLGLALVAQQAELHGGALEIADSPAGGARVRLRLGPARG